MKKATKTIEKYLNGELSGKSLKKFETKLNTDSNLISEYKLHLEVDEAISQTDIIELRNKLSHIQQELKTTETVSRKINTRKLYRVAAALVIFAIVGTTLIYTNLNSSYSLEEIYNQIDQLKI